MLRLFRIVNRNKLTILGIAAALIGLSESTCVLQTRPDEAKAISVGPATTVCDLLGNLPAYNGRVVKVRGIYWNGIRQTCTKPLTTSGHTWPSAVNLVESSEPTNEARIITTDHESWDKLDTIALRTAQAHRKAEIWVTVMGRVRAPTSFVRKDGRVVGGYGHLGVFPAELVVAHVSEIEVRSNPTFDYGQLLNSGGR